MAAPTAAIGAQLDGAAPAHGRRFPTYAVRTSAWERTDNERDAYGRVLHARLHIVALQREAHENADRTNWNFRQIESGKRMRNDEPVMELDDQEEIFSDTLDHDEDTVLGTFVRETAAFAGEMPARIEWVGSRVYNAAHLIEWHRLHSDKRERNNQIFALFRPSEGTPIVWRYDEPRPPPAVLLEPERPAIEPRPEVVEMYDDDSSEDNYEVDSDNDEDDEGAPHAAPLVVATHRRAEIEWRVAPERMRPVSARISPITALVNLMPAVLPAGFNDLSGSATERVVTGHRNGTIALWRFFPALGRWDYATPIAAVTTSPIAYFCVATSRNGEHTLLVVADQLTGTVLFLREDPRHSEWNIVKTVKMPRAVVDLVVVTGQNDDTGIFIADGWRVSEVTLLDTGALLEPQIQIYGHSKILHMCGFETTRNLVALAHADGTVSVWARRHQGGDWMHKNAIDVTTSDKEIEKMWTATAAGEPLLGVYVHDHHSTPRTDESKFYKRAHGSDAWAPAFNMQSFPVFVAATTAVEAVRGLEIDDSIMVLSSDEGLCFFEPPATPDATAAWTLIEIIEEPSVPIYELCALRTSGSVAERTALGRGEILERIVFAQGSTLEFVYGVAPAPAAAPPQPPQLEPPSAEDDGNERVVRQRIAGEADAPVCATCGGEALFREAGGLGRALCSRECQR